MGFSRDKAARGRGKVLVYLCFALLSTETSAQRTFYVSPSGSDGNDGSYSRPWKTLNYSAGKLFPADTLEVMAGTYYEWVTHFVNSGQPGRMITVRNYQNDRAIINGNGKPGVVEFKKRSYYHFKGLEMTNAVWAGFGGMGYHHCRISDCKVYNIGPSPGTAVGIYVTAEYGTYDSTTYNIIERNEIHDIVGEGIYVGNDAKSMPPDGTPCHHNLFRGNTFYRCVEGIEVKTGSRYNRIVGNEFYAGNGGEHSAAVIVFDDTEIDSNTIHDNSNFGIYVQGSRNRVIRNVLYRNLHHAIFVTGSESDYHNYKDAGDDNLFANNTIFDNKDYGIWIWGGVDQDARNNAIQNNILANNGNYQAYFYPQAVQGLRFEANDVVSPSGRLIYYVDTGYSTLAAFTQRSGLGGNCLSVDPHCADTAHFDFHLQNNSPCIDRGVNVGLTSWGTAPDIGAFEYIPVYYPILDPAPAPVPAPNPVDPGLNATVTTGPVSPLQRKRIPVTLTASRAVVQVPTPLYLNESDGTKTTIGLSGTVPGRNFTGVFVVCDTVAAGDARFSLAENALVDAGGNKSNVIAKGDSINIHKTPPAPPAGVKLTLKTP